MGRSQPDGRGGAGSGSSRDVQRAGLRDLRRRSGLEFLGRRQHVNPQAGKVQLSPALCGNGDALVIGVWGGHKVYDGSQTTNGYTTGTRMTHTMAEVGPRGNVAYEGIDATGLVPYSLYEAQLLSRGRRIPGDRIIIAATVTDTFAVLSWTGATGWNYTVRSSTNLMRATEWNNTRFDREPGRDGTMVFTNTNQESPIYFRVLGGLL